MKLLPILTYSVLLVSAASCATHSPPSTPLEREERADELFSGFDIDGDGYLSRAELEGGVRYLAMGIHSGPGSGVMLGLRTKSNSRKSSAKAKPKYSPTTEETQMAIAEAFRTRDQNLDNRLSREEFKKLIVERPRVPSDNDFWEPLM
jgi:Ca2+-binding EF-hand superfamily protein